MKLYSLHLLDPSHHSGTYDSIKDEDIPNVGDVIIETWGNKTRYLTVISRHDAGLGSAVHYQAFVADDVETRVRHVTWHKDYHFRYMKRVA